ncbi:MAG: histidine phosphatase family protein [Ferruginibacter sp.]
MKRLVVVRHAKSSWADIGQKDFDRPLNDRGKKDAPVMGERMLDAGVKINAFVSSPAKRALQTCKAFAEAYGKDKAGIILVEKLYHAPSDIYFEAIKEFDDAHNNVAVFGHNPGITDFVNSLCKDKHIDNMPTCAVFSVQADVSRWKDFEDAEKEFLFFRTPKD